ncbi:D-aminoacyl-tRNA deacylase 1 [Halotydeus destructor]|nr:D-aminoacyl-tRNA deacylase 1 [Halotydeus destructor]
MRAIIQRVQKASVTVNDEVISSIGKGLCVLVGISREDRPEDADYIVRKLINMRLFDDQSGKRWASSVKEKDYEILCVSQFTLCAVFKGNKPDYHCAMPGEQSELFYKTFLEKLGNAYKPDLIKDGKFAAYMNVALENDGPVTIVLDSPPSNTKGDGN